MFSFPAHLRARHILMVSVVFVTHFFNSPLNAADATEKSELFRNDNLVAWCVVPFDGKKRGPEERALMLKKLGIHKLVYDYRSEHVPQWDAEMLALKKHGIQLKGWWFPRTLNDEAKRILDIIRKYQWKECDLWVTGGDGTVESEVERLKPIAEEAARLGIKVGLYNHGGWFGEPENQLKVIEALNQQGVHNVGIVYNLHHGHAHLPRLPHLLKLMMPHLICLNLNGMDVDGDGKGRKILPIGAGTEDLKVLRQILESGYEGAIGILNHTDEDAEARLRDNMRGLRWLVEQWRGTNDQPVMAYETWLERKVARQLAAEAFRKWHMPIKPELWSDWDTPVNRERLYDFYAKQALQHVGKNPLPTMLESYPGLDGGFMGHWGNQNEETWKDARWSKSNLGPVIAAVVASQGKTFPKAVAIRVGEQREYSAVFDPLSFAFPLIWKDGFIQPSEIRRGFMLGMSLTGNVISQKFPEDTINKQGAKYRGYYRDGNQIVFSYFQNGVEWLDALRMSYGKLFHEAAPVEKHSQRQILKGGRAQWPVWITLKGSMGQGKPFAVDDIPVPFENPYGALMFITGHDFFSDGSAVVATMTGEVWLVRGIDEQLQEVKWKRFATGLHQPLGVKVLNDVVHVLGRDQITALRDLNGDGEADFYECVTNAQITSPGGHDYITGLDVDEEGWFYFASGNQGLCRVKPGGDVEVLATGFRNPNGLGLSKESSEEWAVTTSVQEGDWTPASAICQVTQQNLKEHFGAGGPKEDRMPEPPLLYLPRGEDNSSGGQCFLRKNDWPTLRGNGNLVHLSPGMGTTFLVLREKVNNRWQGAAVRIAGGFHSGVQAARFHPKDGHLYVSGMNGWGSYTVRDGCFQRVRHTGGLPMPVKLETRQNGMLLRFDQALDADRAGDVGRHFVQCWNYKYSPAYGSPEWSVKHPANQGHDVLELRSAHVLDDGKTLFLELPQLVPANVVHLHVTLLKDHEIDLFVTVHEMGEEFVDFPGYQKIAKSGTSAEMAQNTAFRMPPPARANPWTKGTAGREIVVEAALGLQYAQRELNVKAGERLTLVFKNPDVVPHNWVLLKPGTKDSVGNRVNFLIIDPTALQRHYVPDTEEVVVYTDMVNPKEEFVIHFDAPKEKGEYPYICTFPGHWQAMNGVLKVE